VKKEHIFLWGKKNRMTTLLEQTLLRMGFHVCRASPKPLLWTAVLQQQPALVLLDHLKNCEALRQHQYARPIVFYSSQADSGSIVKALDHGADDYIVVPFAHEEFAARIRALLRRASYASEAHERQTLAANTAFQSTDGYLILNVATHRVLVGQREVHLTKTEFDLLHCLLQHVDHIVSHHLLLETVWGPDSKGMSDSVRVYIRRLRQKIEPDPASPRYICTRFHQGYLFQSPGKV
jgi:two-component system KDP operon response regulator KdpE